MLDSKIREIGHGDSWKTLEADRVVDGRGGVLTRPFIETHTHGLEGYAVEQGLEAMRSIRAGQRRDGVGRSILSLVALPHKRILELIADAKTLMSEDQGFLGLHLEGPYISAARCGAHDVSNLRAPTESEVAELIQAARIPGKGSVIASMTVAPELLGVEFVRTLVSEGIVMCLGHSEASFEEANEFFASGGSILTHTFNAMAPISHKNPGPIPAAVQSQNVFLELIADGHHVHPSAALMIPKQSLILVSDSMAAAGQGDGEYSLGSLKVQVENGVARVPSGSLAGSTLTLAVAVENYSSWSGDVESAIAAATTNPAAAYGLDIASIYPDENADLVLISPSGKLVEVLNL